MKNRINIFYGSLCSEIPTSKKMFLTPSSNLVCKQNHLKNKNLFTSIIKF